MERPERSAQIFLSIDPRFVEVQQDGVSLTIEGSSFTDLSEVIETAHKILKEQGVRNPDEIVKAGILAMGRELNFRLLKDLILVEW